MTVSSLEGKGFRRWVDNQGDQSIGETGKHPRHEKKTTPGGILPGLPVRYRGGSVIGGRCRDGLISLIPHMDRGGGDLRGGTLFIVMQDKTLFSWVRTTSVDDEPERKVDLKGCPHRCVRAD